MHGPSSGDLYTLQPWVINSSTTLFSTCHSLCLALFIKTKSEIALIFPQFDAKLEKMFPDKIKSIYIDGGTKYIKLEQFFINQVISHYISPLYTLEHIGLIERKHSSYSWNNSYPSESLFCAITILVFYLSNHCVSDQLDAYCHTSSQVPIWGSLSLSPNYSSLNVFDCLCYP